MLGEERARRLAVSVERLLERASALPPDELHRGPGGEEWSVMQVLAHTAEYLEYWARQAAAVAARSEDGLPFGRTHDDPARIAAVAEHAGDRIADVAPRIRTALASAMETLRRIPEDGWRRTGRHERRGLMSVEQIVDAFLLAHAEEHLAQAEGVVSRAATP